MIDILFFVFCILFIYFIIMCIGLFIQYRIFIKKYKYVIDDFNFQNVKLPTSIFQYFSFIIRFNKFKSIYLMFEFLAFLDSHSKEDNNE